MKVFPLCVLALRATPEQQARAALASLDGRLDSPDCRDLLARTILPLCRYFAYVQVAEEEQNLWD